jgi:hypothetical protein
MKATENQKALAELIGDDIRFMIETNDIDSPSHYNLITESVEDLGEVFNLSEASMESLENSIYDIYNLIRNNR